MEIPLSTPRKSTSSIHQNDEVDENNETKEERDARKRKISKRSPFTILSPNNNFAPFHRKQCTKTSPLSSTWPAPSSPKTNLFDALESTNFERTELFSGADECQQISDDWSNGAPSSQKLLIWVDDEDGTTSSSLPSQPNNHRSSGNVTTRRRHHGSRSIPLSPDSDRLADTASSALTMPLSAPIKTWEYPIFSKTNEDEEVEPQFHQYLNIFQFFYENAIASSSNTHQILLSQRNPTLLSLEEVILPAVAEIELRLLKNCQSKQQRLTNNDTNISIIQACRIQITQICIEAKTSASRSRLLRYAMEKRQRKQEKQQRILELKAKRKQEKQRRFHEKKKALPKNKSLWREIAFLTTDLMRVQKEEKVWLEAEKLLSAKEEKLHELENLAGEEKEVADNDDTSLIPKDHISNAAFDNENNSIQNVVKDITLSADRMNETLQTILPIIKESDSIRKDLYSKYRSDLQFHGYPKMKMGTQNLIQAFIHGYPKDERAAI